jgi:hypothetical protein
MGERRDDRTSPWFKDGVASGGTDKYALKCNGRKHSIFAREWSVAHRIHRHGKRDFVKSMFAHFQILSRENRENLFDPLYDAPQSGSSAVKHRPHLRICGVKHSRVTAGVKPQE